MTETAVDWVSSPDPGHWYGADLDDPDWRVSIPTAAIDELETATGEDAEEAWLAGDRMVATRGFLAGVRERLFRGTGAVVAGRLPLAEWGDERAHRAVRLLARLMGPPAQQTHDGVTFYAVADRGLTPGPGVRRSLTSVSQAFHSDGPWVERPPWVVGLHCIRAARSGGISHCISLRALFADLGAEAPALLRRLHRDFLWHRQGEHAPSDPPVSRHPMLWHDAEGRWCGRLYSDYVVNGYREAGVAMDGEARDALASLGRLAVQRHRRLEFRLESGEIEWVNNRWCAHSRTAFERRSASPHPRLLVRVWHRLDGGSTALDG